MKIAVTTRSTHCLLPAYVILIPVMFILPRYSAAGYSILRNTTSHLGAQNTPNAWVMNLVFSLLGIACILEARFHLKRCRVPKILLTIFGLGLIGAAIFQHAPVVEGLPYNLFEDTVHSVFATAVGFSFIFLAVSAAFIETTNTRRIVALVTAVMATVLSVLIFSMADLAGLWQRLMFMISFAWLILFLEGMRVKRQSSGR